jgi:putative iron-dependent peroxidase
MSAGDRVPIDAQSVDAPLSRSAIFLVVTVADSAEALAAVRGALGSMDDLIKDVGFRDLGGRLSCVVGIGSRLWDRLSPGARPAELHEFAPIHGVHTAPSTPGDLLFHIRAERYDLCFQLERMVLDALGDAVVVVDETAAFRYFDSRDLLGFVDGTANPAGADIADAAVVGDEDPAFAGGSYVVVQRYLHDLDAWGALGVEEQQRIIGRTKLDNVELDSATEARPSHKTLATVLDGAGGEYGILRDNMPYGSPGRGEFGTYFIGYSARLWVTERMLLNMFVGAGHGTSDRMLDFSRAVTGTTFFAPSRDALGALAAGGPPAAAPSDLSGTADPSARPADDTAGDRTGSLGIGSLRAASEGART